jgi:hypothetical protein
MYFYSPMLKYSLSFSSYLVVVSFDCWLPMLSLFLFFGVGLRLIELSPSTGMLWEFVEELLVIGIWLTISAVMEMVPWTVNLMALLSRFMMTCLILFWSEIKN